STVFLLGRSAHFNLEKISFLQKKKISRKEEICREKGTSENKFKQKSKRLQRKLQRRCKTKEQKSNDYFPKYHQQLLFKSPTAGARNSTTYLSPSGMLPIEDIRENGYLMSRSPFNSKSNKTNSKHQVIMCWIEINIPAVFIEIFKKSLQNIIKKKTELTLFLTDVIAICGDWNAYHSA
ncbi:hypothetical protein RFI_01191, partial [Reticulomyxa filosa]